MALTSPRITASIYAIERNFGGRRDIPGATNGRTNVFTNMTMLQFYVAPLAVTANGVTMNSVIEVYPTGLNQPSVKYYTDSTTAQLISNGS